jgi:hypothetical protein
MGVGHAALALAAAKTEPRVNVGWLIFAAWFADFLLGIFAALGLEYVHSPADYAARHYLTFTFPYSHGLVSLIFWGIALGLVVARFSNARNAVFIVAALVVSHYFLDALVHVPELPLLGESSPKLGLGLWNHMLLELLLETGMAIVALCLYFSISTEAPLWHRLGILLAFLLLALLTWGQLFVTVAPTQSQLIPGWILLPLLFGVSVYLLDRRRVNLSAG